jgi:hypothetical protein
MKSNLLIAIFFLLGVNALQAQTLNNCKNPCEKQRIVEYGPFIGVRIVNIPFSNHVRISEVLANTSAQKNGFVVNDIITHFNGVEIANTKQLIDAVAKLQPGNEVTLTMLKGRLLNDKKIVLGAQFSKTITETVCCDEPSKLINSINISLSPNPAQNNITLRSNEIIGNDVQITILNLNGSVIKSETRTSNEGIYSLNVDISNLPNGQYFVKLNAGNNQYIHKFLKEK